MTKYSVPEMSCGHCTSAIETAVKALDANAKVNPDLETRTVEIEAAVDEAAILAAMKEEGYEATRVG